MNGSTARSRVDRGPRLSPIVTVLPYVLVALLAAFTAVIERDAPAALAVDLVLCAVAAAWMLWMFTLHPAWRTNSALMAVFVGGLVVVMAVLVLRGPWFGFLAIAGYTYAFTLLPWPGQLFGVAAVAVVAGTAQMSGLPEATPFAVASYVTVLALNIMATCAGAWAFWQSDEQNHQAREANRRLEATLAENAGLQQMLLEQAREAGVRDERQRMAREIHDTLAQGLTGIITQLHAAEQAGADPAGWRRHVDAATRLAKESLSEARRSVHALRPEQLETARLSEALAGVAARWSSLHGVPVEVATTGTVRPVPPGADEALLRTAQEALANVAKHAAARRVGLTLSYLDHEVALDVRDDGQGFVAADRDGDRGGGPSGGGFGLVAMRQRVEGLGGLLVVESEPGVGTAVSARIPVTSTEAEER